MTEPLSNITRFFSFRKGRINVLCLKFYYSFEIVYTLDIQVFGLSASFSLTKLRRLHR